jgi:hypothetical protein
MHAQGPAHLWQLRGNQDAHKLAMAIAIGNQWPSAAALEMLDMRWNEIGSDAIEALLAAATDALAEPLYRSVHGGAHAATAAVWCDAQRAHELG